MTEGHDSSFAKEEVIRLGFFLVRPDVRCCSWPSIPYRGIDRLVWVPEPKVDFEVLSEQERHIEMVWDAYFEARDTGDLHADLNLALHFREQFSSIGTPSEVIHAEVVSIPPNPQPEKDNDLWLGALATLQAFRLSRYERAPEPSEQWSLLGFDVCHPIETFHSVIVQPGLERLVPDLGQRLNRNGLLDTLESSLLVARLANRMEFSWRPFCAIAIRDPVRSVS